MLATTTHVWVERDGRHYDAEAMDGVECWRDLPYFRRNPPARGDDPVNLED